MAAYCTHLPWGSVCVSAFAYPIIHIAMYVFSSFVINVCSISHMRASAHERAYSVHASARACTVHKPHFVNHDLRERTACFSSMPSGSRFAKPSVRKFKNVCVVLRCDSVSFILVPVVC